MIMEILEYLAFKAVDVVRYASYMIVVMVWVWVSHPLTRVDGKFLWIWLGVSIAVGFLPSAEEAKAIMGYSSTVVMR